MGKHIALLSSFRNASAHVPRFFEQVEILWQVLMARGDHLSLIIGEGDSIDNTRDLMLEHWPADAMALIENSHGGPPMGSIVHPMRFAQLSFSGNAILRAIPGDADAVLWVESDILWGAETLLALVEDLREAAVVAPMVLASDHPQRFYDIWAYRKDGRHFAPFPPYHPAVPEINPGGAVEVDSAGTCLAIRGDVARLVTFAREDVIVGLCRQVREMGHRVIVRPDLVVVHP